jgi:pimeloyl-ACP methyl ester carboxylesterase
VITRSFVSAGPPAGHGSRPCQGLYHATEGERPKTAFIATHYNVDFSEHYLAEYLAARGFGFLGWNTRYRGNEAYFALEPALADIGVGVRWLRDEAGVDTVVILGNSGGGSLMGAYLAGSPDVDLYVSVNSHPGRPDVLTAWLDPSVVDESDPLSVDPALDMFNPDNGPPYLEDFVARYRQAQRDRNERITVWAQQQLAHGDRLFTVNRTWADLRFADLTIDPSTRRAGCYAGDPRPANYSAFGLGSVNTLRSWLSMWSLSASACRGSEHLKQITVPSLVVQSTGDRGVFLSDAHAIHADLAATDKELHLMPGEHYFEDGQRDAAADLIADWTTRHSA